MKATLSILYFLSLCGLNLALFRKHIYVNTRLSWQEAQKYCRKHHDDLSTLTPEESRQAVKQADKADGLVWAGLYKSPQSTDQWFWSGGDSETVVWQNNEPNQIEYEHCAGILTHNSLMGNFLCYAVLKIFCMEIFELVLVNENKTWEEALDYCRQNYVDLVSMTSQNITTDLVITDMASITPHVWTGLRFLAGHWFWVSGDEHKAWSECPAKNLHCAAWDANRKVLKPQDCEERLNFFCIKSKNKNTI